MKDDKNPPIAIAPLEHLTLPSHLDGSLVARCAAGTGDSILDAGNDIDAIAKWLGEFAGAEGTFHRYRLEAERCLLWATIERGKPLCTLDDADAHAYGQFLLNLHPRDRWICIGHPRRDDPRWRPFQRPMSPRNLGEAIGILSRLWDWLDAYGYVSGNPWARTMYLKGKSDKTVAPGIGIDGRDNIVTRVEWSYLDAALNEIEGRADEAFAGRARALFYLAYFGDIKPGELAELRTSAIAEISIDPKPVWTLFFQGRPQSRREVALLPPAQQALAHYLGIRGIVPGTLEKWGDHSLIASARTKTSRQTLHSIAKPVFARASTMASADADLLAARRLSHASLQWLRHAFEAHAAHLAQNGQAIWLLLGANFLVPSALHSFLPARVPLSLQQTLLGFEQLQPMWRRAEQGRGNLVGTACVDHGSR